MNDLLAKELRRELDDLKLAGRYRNFRVIQSASLPEGIIQGKRYKIFCSNNYLGLANHPRLRQAACESTERLGSGSGASRLVCGNMSAHVELEEELARFKQAEAAIVFPTGYMANVGTISTLAGPEDTAIIDRLCHASIIDGCRLSGAKLQVYKHLDLDSLEHVLSRSGKYRRRLVITDSIFSMDGDIAPLPQIIELCQCYGAVSMVDEAHATGVFGEHGWGTLEHFGVEGQVDVVMGTLSKAVGSLGGFVVGPQILIDYLRQSCRSFIYTTALPPGVCAASTAGLRLIRDEPQRRQRLWENVEYLRRGLLELGFNLMGSQSQIIPVLLGDETRTMQASEALFHQGILIPGIRPPTVPKGQCRLRITLMADHSREDLDCLLEALQNCR